MKCWPPLRTSNVTCLVSRTPRSKLKTHPKKMRKVPHLWRWMVGPTRCARLLIDDFLNSVTLFGQALEAHNVLKKALAHCPFSDAMAPPKPEPNTGKKPGIVSTNRWQTIANDYDLVTVCLDHHRKIPGAFQESP